MWVQISLAYTHCFCMALGIAYFFLIDCKLIRPIGVKLGVCFAWNNFNTQSVCHLHLRKHFSPACECCQSQTDCHKATICMFDLWPAATVPSGITSWKKVTPSLFFSSPLYHSLFCVCIFPSPSSSSVFMLSISLFSCLLTLLPLLFDVFLLPFPMYMYLSSLGTFVLDVGMFACVCALCVVWVLLKPCCCLRLQQCPASAAQWALTGSL